MPDSIYLVRMDNFQQFGYMTERVLTASPVELIRMLYEGALSSVDLAIEMFQANDIMARGRAITKAVDIIGELRASLRPGAGFSSTLAELYGYMQQRLLEAHAARSVEQLREVSRLLRCLYEGWLGVMSKLSAAGAETDPGAEIPMFVPANPYELMGSSTAQCRSWQI